MHAGVDVVHSIHVGVDVVQRVHACVNMVQRGSRLCIAAKGDHTTIRMMCGSEDVTSPVLCVFL